MVPEGVDGAALESEAEDADEEGCDDEGFDGIDGPAELLAREDAPVED